MAKRGAQGDLFRKPRRKGAGRPKKGFRASERHEVRAEIRSGEPVHVVIRAAKEVGSLRRRDVYRAMRQAIIVTFRHELFHIVHISIQGSHVHLLVEAHDRMALARGMQAFQISAAKHINAAISKQRGERRRGCVFTDRYHVEILKSRRQVRNALCYVLNNWRKHREDRASFARVWRLDPFSSASSFEGWRDVADPRAQFPERYEALPVWKPRSWLLSEGWKLYGRIGSRERPGVARALAE